MLPVVDLSLIFTCGLPSRGDRFVAFDGLADVVVGGGMSIAGARWAAGAGSAGFRCAGQQRRGRADVPKPATDPGRGQPVRGCWAFPGVAQIGDQRSGQAQLDMRGDDQPGPAVGRGRGPDLRAGPAEGLLRLVASRNTPSDSTGQAGRSTVPLRPRRRRSSPSVAGLAPAYPDRPAPQRVVTDAAMTVRTIAVDARRGGGDRSRHRPATTRR